MWGYEEFGHGIEDQDPERILSMDWFKKSFRDARSALGNLAAMASRTDLQNSEISI